MPGAVTLSLHFPEFTCGAYGEGPDLQHTFYQVSWIQMLILTFLYSIFVVSCCFLLCFPSCAYSAPTRLAPLCFALLRSAPLCSAPLRSALPCPALPCPALPCPALLCFPSASYRVALCCLSFPWSSPCHVICRTMPVFSHNYRLINLIIWALIPFWRTIQCFDYTALMEDTNWPLVL